MLVHDGQKPYGFLLPPVALLGGGAQRARAGCCVYLGFVRALQCVSQFGLACSEYCSALVDFSPRLRQQRAVRLVGAVELPANLVEQLAVDLLRVGRSAVYGVECLLDPFDDIAPSAQLRIVE